MTLAASLVRFLAGLGLVAGVVGLAGCGSPSAPERSPASVGPTTITTAPSSVSPTARAGSVLSAAALAALADRLDTLAAYDASAALDLTEAGEPQAGLGDTTVHDVSWASPGGGGVSAWLVAPAAGVPPPYAGLVYVHGSETGRDDLRDEAEAMASTGAVALVLDAPFARSGDSLRDALETYGDPGAEVAMTAQMIVDVRRAYDLLAARPDVDPARLGFVGHSWGAAIGVDVAAVDDRTVAYALLAPRPSWTDFLRLSPQPWVLDNHAAVGDAQWAAYLDAMAPFDALAQVGRTDGQVLLLQYGAADDVVPPLVARALVAAAPHGTTTQWFPDAGHALDAAAVRSRCDWLADRLGTAVMPAAIRAQVGLPDW